MRSRHMGMSVLVLAMLTTNSTQEPWATSRRFFPSPVGVSSSQLFTQRTCLVTSISQTGWHTVENDSLDISPFGQTPSRFVAVAVAPAQLR